MSVRASFRVHWKEARTWPADESRPALGEAVVREAVLLSANELGPHRGEVHIKGLSAEEYDALSEGAVVTVAVG